MNKIIRALALWLVLAQAALAQAALPYPVQFPGPASWCQGMDLCFDYTKGQGSQALAFPPGTDTHPSVITGQSSTGGWQSFNANSPVITDLGLQTVPTRTNVVRNNSMSGAVAGVLGSGGALPTNWGHAGGTYSGLTATVGSTGTENGLPYVDIRYNGTTTNTAFELIFEGAGVVAASAGQTWTASHFVRMVGGTTANIVGIWSQVDGIGGTPSAGLGTSALPTSAMFRQTSGAFSLGTGATSVRSGMVVSLTSGAAVDITFRVYAPQLEQASFASAPILTTSGAATVNGNQQVVDLTGRLGSGVGGIVQVNNLDVSATFRAIAMLNDGTSNNYVILYSNRGSNVTTMFVVTGGATQAQIDLPTAPNTGIATYAFAASTNYAQFRAVGQTAPTADTTVSYPSMSRFAFGGSGFDTGSNAYQLTRRMAVKFGAQNASTFADLFAKATILAGVSP